jgi:hypothetical protein
MDATRPAATRKTHSSPRPDVTLLATIVLGPGLLVSAPALGYGLLVLASMGWTYATVTEPHPFTALGWIWVLLFGVPGLVGTLLAGGAWWARLRSPWTALCLGLASWVPAGLGLWLFVAFTGGS